MAKKRPSIPRATRDRVLAEFNHRCAICDADKPHVHHIDGDRTNNELLNLLPLCPNCHLLGEHDSTRPVDPKRLRLFRECKDPAILKPQFEPLFLRMEFLDDIQENSDACELARKSSELVEFVKALTNGAFYSKRVDELTRRKPRAGMIVLGNPESERRHSESMREYDKEYRDQLRHNRDRVYKLIVELLRFQRW